MYPAEDGFGSGFFTVDDLPEELEIYESEGPPSNNLVGPAIATYNGNGTWGSFNSGNGPYVEFAGDGWLTVYDGGGPGGPAPCLITDQFNDPAVGGQGRYYIFDRFKDTYKITLDSPALSNPQITFVQRTGLCTWFQEDGQDAIIYIDNPDSENHLKWVIQIGGEGSAVKGQQNKPDGTDYTITSGIHVGGTIQVE